MSGKQSVARQLAKAHASYGKELVADSERMDRAVLSIMAALEDHAVAQDVAGYLTTIASASASTRFVGQFLSESAKGEAVPS